MTFPLGFLLNHKEGTLERKAVGLGPMLWAQRALPHDFTDHFRLFPRRFLRFRLLGVLRGEPQPSRENGPEKERPVYRGRKGNGTAPKPRKGWLPSVPGLVVAICCAPIETHEYLRTGRNEVVSLLSGSPIFSGTLISFGGPAQNHERKEKSIVGDKPKQRSRTRCLRLEALGRGPLSRRHLTARAVGPGGGGMSLEL